jgi:hypothetical protein
MRVVALFVLAQLAVAKLVSLENDHMQEHLHDVSLFCLWACVMNFSFIDYGAKD